MTRSRPYAALFLAAAALLVGCSDGGGSSSDSSDGGAAGSGPACLHDKGTGKAVELGLSGGGTTYGYEAGSGKAGVVLAHQSNNDVCSWLPKARELAGDGYRVLAVDSIGQEVAEIRAAAERLRKDGARKILLVGASKGGTATVQAAPTIKPPAAAVVAISSPRKYQSLDAGAAAPGLTMPGLFMAARDDLPYADDIRKLYKSAVKSPGRRLELVDGSDHGIDIFSSDPDAWRQLEAFLAKYR